MAGSSSRLVRESSSAGRPSEVHHKSGIPRLLVSGGCPRVPRHDAFARDPHDAAPVRHTRLLYPRSRAARRKDDSESGCAVTAPSAEISAPARRSRSDRPLATYASSPITSSRRFNGSRTSAGVPELRHVDDRDCAAGQLPALFRGLRSADERHQVDRTPRSSSECCPRCGAIPRPFAVARAATGRTETRTPLRARSWNPA